ncbi:MAG: hypothetical protein V9G04_09570 [Nocardioides sp.]|jgi:hypothetical protein
MSPLNPWGRRERLHVEVAPGERLLASCRTRDGAVLGGTRAALYLPTGRVPWESVQAADWDRESETLRVSEVGDWGAERPIHTFVLDEPGDLLTLVHERVQATLVVQRHAAVTGRLGLRVIARRAPQLRARTDEGSVLRWYFEYDEGLDPDDPEVRRVAQAALRAARSDVGDL